MDDYIFRAHIQKCKYVPEDTRYLEIFNYSGAFQPPALKDGVKLLDGIRLVIQKNAKQDNTFTPNFVTLEPKAYESMVRTWHLPLRAIEGSSLVGPFFACAFDQDEDDRHLQIIFRKSDVRKKGKTRGWEIMLSYSFNTGITTGYVKGTSSSDINDSLEHLKACRAEAGHPLLLPTIILAHDLAETSDIRQRSARDWLRRLENAITMRDEIDRSEVYTDFDVDGINRDLVECHSQVLWKRPQAYQEILKDFKSAMEQFRKYVRDDKFTKVLKALHGSVLARLDFYRVKLTGMEHYAHTTLERLHIQRQALYNIMAQKESKLNLEMAAQQRRLAHASKRDSTAMKTLSLLGAVFLPGTFLSSVFSMTFFDFNVGPEYGPDVDTSGEGAQVSEYLWIYFVVTIPLTLLIVGSWWFLDRRRERQYALEDEDIERGIERLETDILAVMRKKTMSKASTWNSGSQAFRVGQNNPNAGGNGTANPASMRKVG
ncbi:hypothetical protein MGN70_010665 [Eutypa lata]|uniref:Uncharacterized protein n=1 Tax=Eutypa lata (strain UCR-EL1) TaxID=1287681 RepID=M7SJ98_EUTLA|nr:hypothetical protein UCREL1_8802 [Eutypa lata UCREL1]KAI1246782.1 hypothetical protein MGN70_010665 [Eutypa lata]